MRLVVATSVALVLSASASALAVNFTSSGYSENFNSMGTAGVAAPLGWKHFSTGFGSNSTWVSSIPASGASSVASMAVGTAGTVLTATNAPTANNNSGFNAANGVASNRALATAPTTVAGSVLQLELTNASGNAYSAGTNFTISFDTIRYNVVSSANQLPGYWLFMSLDGVNWTNILTNPTLADVPNTIGVTSRTSSFALTGAWNAGATAYFRWVDDNAQQTSPDQIIGLDNVSIIPAPGALTLAGFGCVLAARRRRN